MAFEGLTQQASVQAERVHVALPAEPAEQTTDPSIRGPDVQQRTEAVIERLGLGARCGLLRQQLVPVDDGRGNVDEFAVRDTRLVA